MAHLSKEGQKMRDDMNLPLIEVMHTEGSSKYRAKHFNSWTEFWENKNSSNSFPANQKCDCCQKVASCFVGGHVTAINSGKTFIYPICKVCNDKYGDGKPNKTFQAKVGLLVPFNPNEDAYIITPTNE